MDNHVHLIIETGTEPLAIYIIVRLNAILNLNSHNVIIVIEN